MNAIGYNGKIIGAVCFCEVKNIADAIISTLQKERGDEIDD